MIDLIFWLLVAAYWVVGFKRIPIYYRRWYDASKKEWSYRSEQEHQRSGVWCALGLAAIWQYYEGGRLLRDGLIHSLTAEERRQKEYEAAERIVAEYTARKKREEQQARDEFDRKLRGH